MWLTEVKEPKLPDDVKYFINEIRKEGYMAPCKIALQIQGPKYRIIDICYKEEKTVNYSDVVKVPDIIECDNEICALIVGDSIKLVFERDTRKIHKPAREVA